MTIDSHGVHQELAGQRTAGREPQALVFIHGFLDSHATWGPLMDALPMHAAQSIASDLHGAGKRQTHAGPRSLNGCGVNSDQRIG